MCASAGDFLVSRKVSKAQRGSLGGFGKSVHQRLKGSLLLCGLCVVFSWRSLRAKRKAISPKALKVFSQGSHK
jgi:hypothetical protein